YYLLSNLADQALVSFERAEKILGDVQDKEYLCKVYEKLGKMWLSSSEIERARKYAKLLKDLVQDSSNQVQETTYLKLSGALAAFQEKFEKAEEYYLKAQDIFERQRIWRELNLLKIELADIFVKQGEYFRALTKLSEARLYFEEQGSGKEIKRIRNAELSIDKELGKYGEDYRNLRMLLEISKALSQIGDVDELLPMIVDMAIKVSGAERGFVMLLTPSGKLEFSIGRSQKKEDLTKERFDFSTTVTDIALSERKLVCITDTATDEKFRARESIVGLSLRSIMCAPLHVGDDVLGLIYVDSQVPTFYFSRKNAEFFEALCSHAAIALHQARLHHQSIEDVRLFEENRATRELEKQKKEFVFKFFEKISGPIDQIYDILDKVAGNMVHAEDLTALSNQAKNNIVLIKDMIDQSMKS
ncbi:MAG: GAF domain-containing protein, partial [Caldisericales bacterium]|nr:GAF domain-containing protein [Caldisericales bacterium]